MYIHVAYVHMSGRPFVLQAHPQLVGYTWLLYKRLNGTRYVVFPPFPSPIPMAIPLASYRQSH